MPAHKIEQQHEHTKLNNNKMQNNKRIRLAPSTIMNHVMTFCDFDSLLRLRLANQQMLSMVSIELEGRMNRAFQEHDGVLGDFRLYLQPVEQEEGLLHKNGNNSDQGKLAELPTVIQEAILIPQSGPFQVKMNTEEIANLLLEITKDGYACHPTPEGGQWSFEVCFQDENDLREYLEYRYPNQNLPLPMKAVSDVFHYLRAIGWSLTWHRTIFKAFKRYLLPLRTATLTGHAHSIVEHDEGDYIYKEVLTFRTLEGAKYELVAIDRDPLTEDQTIG